MLSFLQQVPEAPKFATHFESRALVRKRLRVLRGPDNIRRYEKDALLCRRHR